MSFIPPLMGAAPRQSSSQKPHDTQPENPPQLPRGKKLSITNRPELIGGVPLYLLSRINALLPFPSAPSAPPASPAPAPPQTPSETLHGLAEHMHTTETMLKALQAEAAYLGAQLARREEANPQDGGVTRRLFTQLCTLQTRYARAERDLAALARELKDKGRALRSVEADLVVLWIAFIGLSVAFLGYVAGERIG